MPNHSTTKARVRSSAAYRNEITNGSSRSPALQTQPRTNPTRLPAIERAMKPAPASVKVIFRSDPRAVVPTAATSGRADGICDQLGWAVDGCRRELLFERGTCVTDKLVQGERALRGPSARQARFVTGDLQLFDCVAVCRVRSILWRMGGAKRRAASSWQATNSPRQCPADRLSGQSWTLSRCTSIWCR